MPEIKHNFLKGRMNKDLDERLVPNGEYRDALNIEVNTSEGSNVGSAQNIKSNKIASGSDHQGASFLSDDSSGTGINRNAITVGSYSDESTKTIFNFIHKASDLVEDGVYGGLTRFTGVRSDVISMYVSTASESGFVYPLVTDVFEAKIAPTTFQTSQNGVIEGVPTQVTTTSGGQSVYTAKGVVPGMKVRLLDLQNNNLYGSEEVVVKEVVNSLTPSSVKIITTIPSSAFIFDAAASISGYVFQFISNRILNFQSGVEEIEQNVSGQPTSTTQENTIITGINYENNILFYTDGRNEPKRIVVDRFKNPNGTFDAFASVERHSVWKSEVSATNSNQSFNFEEKHITTIRKNPRLAPRVIAKSSNRPTSAIGNTGLNYQDINFSSVLLSSAGSSIGFNFLNAAQDEVIDSSVDIEITAINSQVNWRVGDILVLTGTLSAAVARVKIVAADVSSSSVVGSFTIRLIDIEETYFPLDDNGVPLQGVPPTETWNAIVSNKKQLYPTSFIYFAYRYKYIDNEYSAISPYSKAIFLPSFYAFNAVTGFNVGMENQLRHMKVIDFVEQGISRDVSEVEILFKTSDSENVYVIDTIQNNSSKWNDTFDAGSSNTGILSIEDSVFGRTLESQQLIRPFDAVPISAKSQEFSSNRLMYGNYVSTYPVIDSTGDKVLAEISSTLVNRDVSTTTTVIGNNITETNINQQVLMDEEGVTTFGTSLLPGSGPNATLDGFFLSKSRFDMDTEISDDNNSYDMVDNVFVAQSTGHHVISLSFEIKFTHNPITNGDEIGLRTAQGDFTIEKIDSSGNLISTLSTLNTSTFPMLTSNGLNSNAFGAQNSDTFHVFSETISFAGNLTAGDTLQFMKELNLTAEFSTGHVQFHQGIIEILNAQLTINSPQTSTTIVTSTPKESVKSTRDYQVGVVYGDYYGRESEILFDAETTINSTQQDSITANKIQSTIKNQAPYWADYYKFFVKEIAPEYFNIVLFKAYPNDGVGGSSTFYYWLSFNSVDRNKIQKDDYLLLKKVSGNNNAPILPNGSVDDQARWRVLDIVGTPEKITEDDAATTTIDETVFGLQGVPIDASVQDISGKFFVKIEADSQFDDYIGNNFSTSSVANGAVFEVEKKSTITNELFYEASQAYPIKLGKYQAEHYVRVNSKIETGSMSTFVDLENGGFRVTIVQGACSYASNYYNTTFPDDYYCLVSFANSAGQSAAQWLASVNLNLSGIHNTNLEIIRFSQDDGSFVSARIASIDLSNNIIKLVPFTQPYNQPFNYENPICFPWYNCFSFGNGVESDRIRDDFNASTIYPYAAGGKQSGFKASLPILNYERVEKPNEIIFSQIFNESTSTSRYNEFILADNITKRLNSEYGSIQKLYSRQSDLLAFCENKVLQILANKDALFNADGNPQLLSSTNVLGHAKPFTGDYGISNNPESFAVEEYRIYFADKFRGAVCRLSMDGITAISDAGMKDFFNDNLKMASCLVGSYDGKKNEYNVTIHSSTNPGYKKDVYTISYSEGVKGWTSFKSFIKESGLSMNNEYYTFKNGDMYLHHSNSDDITRNEFYGTQYTSTIDMLFNDFSGSVKLFKTINYEGTQSKEI